MRSYISHSTAETEAIAAGIGALLHSGDVVAYRGGMGAGKTAFTRGLARGMGIDDSLVSSPTFALVQEYSGQGLTLYHFDMHRITGSDDLFSTGFYEYTEAGGVVAVEWSENVPEDLPKNAVTITIEPTPGDECSRLITVKGDDRF